MRNDLRSARQPAFRQPQRPPFRIILLGLLAAILLAGLGWWVYDRFIRSDEDKIRALIQAAAKAARERRPAGLMAILADDFVAYGPGEAARFSLDRDACHRLLVHLLMSEFRHIEVALPQDPIPVTVSPDRQSAAVDLVAHVRGKWTDESDWIDVSARVQANRFALLFKRRENVWKLCEVRIK